MSLPIIGVIGGIASGKSAVARLLAEQGGEVIDADRLGHEVLCDPDVRRAARQRWGDEIFGANGHVDRTKLAAVVFAAGAEKELAYLQQLTHPRITERVLRRIDEITAAGRAQAIVLDAAVMVESGWHEKCHKLVFVDLPRALRRQRAIERGWQADDFDRREAAQESLEVKQKLADAVVDNSGDLASTAAQIARLWPSLVPADSRN